MIVQALLWETVESPKDQGAELETLTQKETIKDVKINLKNNRQRFEHYWNSTQTFLLMFQVSPTSASMWFN